MKRLIVILAAAAATAFVFLRAGPPAAPVSTGWTAAAPAASAPRERPGRRDAAPEAARALAYVAGDVVRPGVYPVAGDARVRDAIALAGGTRPGADLLAVNLAAHVRDGDAIVVPARGEAAARTAGGRRARRSSGIARANGTHRGARAKHRRSRRSGAVPAAMVDINTADAETLATIPGSVPDPSDFNNFCTIMQPF